MNNFVITIARGFGSGGKTIGQMLSHELNVGYYDKELIHLASEESGINISLFGKADEKIKTSFAGRLRSKYKHDDIISPESGDFVSNINLFNYQAKVIKDIANRESCIIVGRCADYILAGMSNVVRVFFYADFDSCVKNVMDKYGWDAEKAKREIERIDREKSAYYKHYTGHNWDNAKNYDLCLNSSELGYEKCVRIIKSFIEIKSS